MNKNDFMDVLNNDVPRSDFSPLLQALWWDKKGDWDRAHQIAQDIISTDGSRVHAYLHRVEGDKWNANYWYDRAGISYSTQSLEEEWESLLEEFLPE